LLPEDVAEAAQGGDADIAAFELLAHAMHIDLDGVGIGVILEAEDAFRQGRFCDGLAGALQQHLEHGPLARRQGESVVTERELPAVAVEGEGAQLDQRILLVPRAPELRPDARFQLAQVERLGKIVVGAAVEAGDTAGNAGIGREDQDRDRSTTGPQPAQYLHAAHARQGQIEDHQGIRLRLQGMIGILAVMDAIDHVVVLAQGLGKPVGQLP